MGRLVLGILGTEAASVRPRKHQRPVMSRRTEPARGRLSGWIGDTGLFLGTGTCCPVLEEGPAAEESAWLTGRGGADRKSG